MIFDRKKKKQLKQKEAEMLYTLATKPASVNTTLLIADVKETIRRYIYAIYAQREEYLPMNQMKEEVFLAIQNSIQQDIGSGVERTVETLEVVNVKPIDYDNRIFYAVQSITYEVTLNISGSSYYKGYTEPFNNRLTCSCMFVNDSRMGWLLYQCELET